MPRVKISRAGSDRRQIEIEVARLRDLDLGELRARWHTVFGRRPPSSLARHLLFRVLAYRVQADALGDLDRDCQRILDRANSLKAAGKQTRKLGDVMVTLQQGTATAGKWLGTIAADGKCDRCRADRSMGGAICDSDECQFTTGIAGASDETLP